MKIVDDHGSIVGLKAVIPGEFFLMSLRETEPSNFEEWAGSRIVSIDVSFSTLKSKLILLIASWRRISLLFD